MKVLLIVITLLSLFVGWVVIQSVVSSRLSPEAQEIFTALKRQACSSEPPRGEVLHQSTLPDIRRLADYETRCKSAVTDQLVYHVTLPSDSITANQLAARTASALVEYEKYQIRPLVFVQPFAGWTTSSSGKLASGGYDAAVTAYFKQLQALGVTKAQMGTWTPFPLPNLPNWGNASMQPADFTKSWNRYVGILRRYYPETPVSVLLSSATYNNPNFSWSEGEYVSLLPYLKDLTPNTLDSLGVQGFPWLPAANTTGASILEPAEFLTPPAVREAIKDFNIKKVWFHTGTFAASYTTEPKQIVQMPASVRQAILAKVLKQAGQLKNQGQEVSINLVAFDASSLPENSDWSYWGSDNTSNPAHAQTILDFLMQSRAAGIPVTFQLFQ